MGRLPVLRLLLGLGGVTLIAVGLLNSLALGFIDLLWLGLWLGAGLVVHDGLLAPGTAGLSKVTARWPARRRRIALVATVTIGSLTLIALPMIMQQDAVPGNPTLLGRNYLVGWAVACLLVLAGAALAALIARLRVPRDPA